MDIFFLNFVQSEIKKKKKDRKCEEANTDMKSSVIIKKKKMLPV